MNMARYYARAAAKTADYGQMINEVGEVNDGGTIYKVAIYQYENHALKVSLEKMYWSARDNAYQHSNLGRLTPEVAAALGPLLVEASVRIHRFLSSGSF
jgi:hypothetical protein